TRRGAYRRGGILAERVAALEALPGWTWSVPDSRFAEKLAALVAYQACHGDCEPRSGSNEDGKHLRVWVARVFSELREGPWGRIMFGGAGEASADLQRVDPKDQCYKMRRHPESALRKHPFVTSVIMGVLIGVGQFVLVFQRGSAFERVAPSVFFGALWIGVSWMILTIDTSHRV
ncbi:MAG: hypothetical protein QOK39_244, partial [Acidimicrobiaceae bacterium]|nr:hypothetical protein [Acidimicrobiaceae bacterium]